jgi:DNA-binding MarR family transcriptional regulator
MLTGDEERYTSASFDTCLRKTLYLLDTLTQHYPIMSVHTAMAFLLVCKEEGVTVYDVKNRLSLEMSGATRSIALMTDRHRRGKQGLEFVYTKPDLEDRRVKRLYLTPKGRKVRAQIQQICLGT